MKGKTESELVRIKPVRIKDAATGLVLEVAIMPHYFVILAGNRCFYFTKTGEFDGACTRVGDGIEQARG